MKVIHIKNRREEPAMTDTRKPAKSKSYEGFSEEERAAMKDRAKELKSAGRRGSRADQADGESQALAKIAEMQESDRALAEGLHAIVKASAPDLSRGLWYGMPAYSKGGTMICFFQTAQKFKTRYAMLGFSDKANLDEGDIWPTSYALTELTPAAEARISALIKQAVS
jgi:uncharacterized protein YdhG (YjbR/CyaY superfamily)